jgi:hypothetical protein
MNFNFKYPFPALLGMLLVVSFFISCEEELTTVGAGVVGSEPFTTGKAVFDVFAYNENVAAVQTNKLGIYQLGTFNDPVYGATEALVTSQLSLPNTNPTFGVSSQSIEDGADSDNSITTIPENETVTEVVLYIPYLTKNTARDTDLDGVEDAFDTLPEDPNNDSDADGVSNRNEQGSNTDPLDPNSVDANSDGLNDTDDTPILADGFARQIELDSVYYNNKTFEEFKDQEVVFNLKVERSTFFLRDLDPNANFQEAQSYYSSQEFSPAFVSDILFNGPVEFSNKEILLPREDDPETPDIDESNSNTKIAPGIRIPLDTEFFQNNILDKEGSAELLSQANFNDFLRGLHFTLTTPGGNHFYLLFDLRQANITISYTYDRYDTNNTVGDTADDGIIEVEANYTLSFLRQANATSPINGNAVNTFNNEAYPAEIANALGSGENAPRIYVKGGAGATAQISLFEPQAGGMEIINEIKANNWVINEANLVFYIDQEALAGQVIEPPRLYLYNQDNNQPLYNPFTEQSVAESLFGRFLNYDGLIERGADGQGSKYTVKITDHINNIIVRDSANAPLGLTLTTDIRFIATAEAILGEGEKNLPITATITPLGTVLYGPNLQATDPEFDKRLKLEVFYTAID